jgi:dTDP-4-amino-4,6-dideoxygalactose transaminase
MNMKKRSKFIPFALPSFSGDEEEAMIKVLRSGWVSTGKVCKEFEHAFARRLDVKHALALNSATAGLHLSLKALGIQENDRILTTPFTFTASAEIARYENAHPVFADIDEEHLNIDPDKVEAAFKSGKNIKALIPVHIAGIPCDMERLMDVSRRYKAAVIEDSAHAFPVRTPLGLAGSVGDLGVFSFYATKPITTGEGGMVVTNNDEYARQITLLRLHGINKIVWDRYHEKKSSWEYDVVAPGYKYNLSDLLAALGVEQLKKTGMFLQRRREIAMAYQQAFTGEDYLRPPAWAEDHCWHLYILRIIPEKMNISRDDFLGLLSEANIGVSIHFRPLHLMSYYRDAYNLKPRDFPVAYRVYQTCFSIPIYYGLQDEEVDYIIKQITAIGRKHRK